ncbi:MAG: DEAD/DEAH box helicase family protein, partial [Planctomycetia bacterium]|nr:DEAD/DEAH box helicase family protein [Planctomycetia bacterium]
SEHWHIVRGEPPERRPGRRPASYIMRDPTPGAGPGGVAVALELVNRIRGRLAEWRAKGRPGVTRATRELLEWWERPDREDTKRLFFTQREAAETVVFLTEARADFLQGIAVPRDEPDEKRRAEGFAGFVRYACKMATGSGKTTVMGMLAAWSILNKLDHRGDKKFSEVVLVICPNVTIRDRLRELDPRNGEASVYRTRDLVPPHRMERLAQGRVLVMNWHLFEPQGVKAGGEGGRVLKAGVPVETVETIRIGPKNTTARGSRYLTLDTYQRQVDTGLLTVVEEVRDKADNLTAAKVRSVRYVESDTALANRLLGREVGGKGNILVLNDEAHHAYRIRRPEKDDEEDDLTDTFGEEEEAEEFFREATVWVEGLDRIHKLRGINFCVDLSATPYFLGRIGQDAGRPFPWVVSDFGLTDAIESGLVKIPQLVVRDTTGADVPGYFNIWEWVLKQMTPAERGAKKASPKPEAVLKYAHTPIAMLAADWEKTGAAWEAAGSERPPVFIFVCKNTAIAKAVFEWIAEGREPPGVPPLKVEGFRNRDGQITTIRVDTKVVHETDTGEAKSDEMRWLRFTLDTVGKRNWPSDATARPLYPEGFEDLAKKLGRPLHPPGRDVRCIVSVAMLTEGWDCNTVTHIVGLRPFQSQLLCEQVVGRGLRRASYDVGEDGKLSEEVAKVFGVPFDLIPLKATKGGPGQQKPRHLVRAIPAKAEHEICFPRVEGYTQAVRNQITVDWDALPSLTVDPSRIPPEVEVKAALPDNEGRPSLTGPGRLETMTLNSYRHGHRVQELAFDLAATVTRAYAGQPSCELPPHVLFPQLLPIVRRYLDEKVRAVPPAEWADVFCSPYYGWAVERLTAAVRGDPGAGEPPEIPVYEAGREPGTTAEVSFWTGREVREVVKSHLNYVVADTKVWEQSAAYRIDKHPRVTAFVKNAGLGFGIPYLHNGQDHEYLPDFLIRLKTAKPAHLILEMKGYDELADVKRAAALRWCAAVNAEGSFGHWQYALARRVEDVTDLINTALGAVPG